MKTTRLVLALALAVACGAEPAGAQLWGGGGVWGAPPAAAGGAEPALTPVFDFNPGAGSGVTRRTAPSGWTTAISCDMRDATNANLACDTGGTWVEADGDVIVGGAAPFTELAARSAFFNGFYSYEAPLTATGNIASTDDFIIQFVGMTIDRGATQYFWSHHDTVASEGPALRVSAAGIVQGLVNNVAVGSHQLDAFGEWNIYTLWRDSGVCGLDVNGQQSGSTAACTGAVSPATNPKNFAIGCRPNGTNNDCIDGNVSNLDMWTRTAAVGDESAATIASRMAYELMGVYPDEAVTAQPLATDIRSTRAALEITRGTQRFTFPVGPGWVRTVSIAEEGVGGAIVAGYLSEVTSTNLLLRTREFDHAYWTITAGDSINANNWVAPIVDQNDFEAERYNCAADGVGVEHKVTSSAVTLAASTDYLVSVFFGYDGTDTTGTHGWIRAPGVSSTAIGWVDIKNCVARTGGAGLKQYTSGPYANVHAKLYGVQNSTQQWCRASIVVTGDADADTIEFGFSKADAVTTTTTSLNEHLGALWGAQAEVIQTGVVRPFTSYIITSTATQQRLYDGLRFDIANWPAGGGTILVDFMLPNTKIKNDSGNPAEWLATPYKDSNNYIHMKATQGTGQALLDGVCSSGGGMYFDVLTAGTHELLVCGQAGFGQFYSRSSGLLQPGANLLNNPHDGVLHTARFVVLPNDARGYFDGDVEPGVADTTVALPTLTGGRIEIGYSGTDGSSAAHAGPGIIKRVRIYDVEVDDDGNAVD